MDHGRARLNLPNGGLLEINPDEHQGWQGTQAVSIGLALPRFAKVMSGWPEKMHGPLLQLDPRKSRQDTAGYILWSGVLPFENFPAKMETTLLGLYDRPMQFDHLLTQLMDVNDTKSVALRVFGYELGAFVMPTEGLWTFLFLLAEADCDAKTIGDIYTDLKSQGAAFGTNNSLTRDVIDAYLVLHAEQLRGT